jgi:hypothetical protein
MNPNSPNQQPMPGGMPVNPGQPQPGMPYVPQHGLAETAANIQAAPIMNTGVPLPPGAQMPMGVPQPQRGIPQPLIPGQPPVGTVQGGVVTGGAPVNPNGPTVKPVAKAINPNSTQNMLQIAEIRDGIVIMSDGSFRSVIMVKSINFDLMSQQEQEAVEYNYQNFLNSLYFPIQIFIRSQKVDIAPYLEKLDKIRSEHDNMLLALLMDDYIGYITALSQQTNIMDKKFYIVIPFFPHVDVQKALTQSKNFITGISDLFGSKEQHVVINEEELEKAKTELRTRVQTVLSGLLQSNIQGLPLDTQELIELFYDTYNPDTATRQQLKNFNSMTADIITKGQGAAPQPHLERELN